MPLQHLIDSFNDRFIAENHLKNNPLRYLDGKVHGVFGQLTFGSDLRPVHYFSTPERLSGHDAAPVPFVTLAPGEKPSFSEHQTPNIVSLDRLTRTVHMLNYLTLNQEEGHLFLDVHPRHVLTVQQDHGAYFEDIIRRCGLPLRRIVISLAINRSHEHQMALLLERLRNYRDRGYSTAIRFDDETPLACVDHFKAQYLHRFPPDVIRFSSLFFHRNYQEPGGLRRRNALLAALRQIDTEVFLDAIKDQGDADLAEAIRPDHAQGPWLDAQNRVVEPLLKAI
ncbi:MAG: hypothetical protein ACOYLM_13175 [Methylococcaceae bacterium]